MSSILKRYLVIGLGLALGAAGTVGCGTNGEEQRIRVTVSGVNDGEHLETDEETELSHDAVLYSALMRFGAVSVLTDLEERSTSAATNADLYSTTIVFEEAIAGSTVESVTLELPSPESAGVAPGELVSVFAAGLVDDERFEYRDVEMAPLTISLGQPLTGSTAILSITFDLHDWFKDIEKSELEAEQSPPYQVDATTTPEMAAEIESRISESVLHEAESDDDSSDDEEPH